MGHQKLSVYLSFLLRHEPWSIDLEMDKHGWVEIAQLIENINKKSRYSITKEVLENIVAADEKGRYRISEDGRRIKACQGHSIPWVEVEIEWMAPPDRLYHGTTMRAYSQIMDSGYISKMKRHAVHMQAEPQKAWQSAFRHRGQAPVLLVIDAAKMAADGYLFGLTDNQVWCTERVPKEYICGAEQVVR